MYSFFGSFAIISASYDALQTSVFSGLPSEKHRDGKDLLMADSKNRGFYPQNGW